jgi:hypothetical protein
MAIIATSHPSPDELFFASMKIKLTRENPVRSWAVSTLDSIAVSRRRGRINPIK